VVPGLTLTQGTRTVLQYEQAFNCLCQYADYHADSDTKKQDRFCRGLSTKPKECLKLVKANVAEPTWIIPAQVRESTPEGSNVLQTV
jgi:hypothetical protein